MNFKERLLELNKRGLIHAPDESDEQFFHRCRTASISSTAPSSSLAKEIFDIDPDWVYLVYDNKGLRFWEGGCTWLKQDYITLQLNKAFQRKPTYFGYSREEVIAHELVHVVRGNFEEPIFEEILAYQTSSSGFRRFFAPLFRNGKETTFFVFSLTAFFLAALFDTFQNIALLGVLCLLLGGVLRLAWTQHIFTLTKKKLTKLVGKEKVLAVMLRMTDREIIRFSKMKPDEIAIYIQKMSKIHMRWQQIYGSYFIQL